MKLYMAHCSCGMAIDDNWRCCPMCGEEVERDHVTEINVGKMTIEEAIEILKNPLDYGKYSAIRIANGYQEASGIAIEALSKQVPMKPIAFTRIKTDGVERLLHMCVCGMPLSSNDRWCSECGQHIDYERKNEEF